MDRQNKYTGTQYNPAFFLCPIGMSVFNNFSLKLRNFTFHINNLKTNVDHCVQTTLSIFCIRIPRKYLSEMCVSQQSTILNKRNEVYAQTDMHFQY